MEKIDLYNSWNIIKKILFFFSFFYLTLYVPFTFVVYSNTWYNFNFERQDVYLKLDKDLAKSVTNNLVNYLWYKEELSNDWDYREKIHYEEVRSIFGFLFILFLFSLFGMFLLYDKKLISKFAKYNLFIIILLILVITPFFAYFWDNIFHEILFSNSYWLMDSSQVSYYLFSYDFFINCFIFIFGFSCVVNISIIALAKFYKIS